MSNRPDHADAVPAALAYLIEPARLYGRDSDDVNVANFVLRASPNDLAYLSSLADRIRLAGHAPAINVWLREVDWIDTPIAGDIDTLMGVLDGLGLQFE